MRNLFLLIVIASLFLLIGCSNNDNVENDTEFDEIRKIAWDFVNEQGWITADEDWQSAEVKEVVVNQHHELFDEAYKGKTVLSVSFLDKENVLVVGTPDILVDPETGKIIGYMPGE